MGEGLYYLSMGFVIAELVLAQSLLAVIGLGLTGVLLTCALCIMGGLELFGLAVLMTYSSVFLFLSVFAVYLGGAWNAGGEFRWGGGVVPALTLAAGGFWAFSFGAQGGWCGMEVIWEDSYAAWGQVCTSAITLIHMFFMRLFVVEATLLNIYIFLGLVVALLVLGLVATFGGGLGPSARLAHGLRQTRRVASPKSSRRSWRRRNSSIIRELKWPTAEHVFESEMGAAPATSVPFTRTPGDGTGRSVAGNTVRVQFNPFRSCHAAFVESVTAPCERALWCAFGWAMAWPIGGRGGPFMQSLGVWVVPCSRNAAPYDLSTPLAPLPAHGLPNNFLAGIGMCYRLATQVGTRMRVFPLVFWAPSPRHARSKQPLTALIAAGPWHTLTGTPLVWPHTSSHSGLTFPTWVRRRGLASPTHLIRPRYDRFRLWKYYRCALAYRLYQRMLTQRRLTNAVCVRRPPSPLWFMYNWKYIT